MKAITKREFEVIALYSKGLKFKEIGHSLNIAERTAINYYMRVKAKSKQHITKAKHSRAISKQLYKMRLKEVIHKVREHNNEIRRYGHNFIKQISLKNQSKILRLTYFDECLEFAFSGYCRMKLKNIKKRE